MSRLTRLIDQQSVRLLGDEVVIDGRAVRGYFYKSVMAPEFGTQNTELVEFYVDVFPAAMCGLPCSTAQVNGAQYDVVRQGEADDTSMIRLHLKPAGNRQIHQDAGV